MVASEMGQAGFDAAKEIGIDLSAHAISVEESARAIKQMVIEFILRARKTICALELTWFPTGRPLHL